MSSFSFYLALLLSLLYATITVVHVHESRALDKTVEEQHTYQLKMAHAERTSQFTQQLVQRLAVDSVHDTALADLLRKNGVQVTFTGTTETTDTAKTNP